jgi:hypothetical protein
MRLTEFTDTFSKKKLNEAGPAVLAVPVGIGAMEALGVALGFAGATALAVDIQQNPNKYNAAMRAAATAYTATIDYLRGGDAVESVPANVASELETAATQAILSQPAEIQSSVSSQTQEIINRVDRDADAMASGEMSASDIVARMSAEIRAKAAASRAARAAGTAVPVAFASDPDVPVFAPEPAAAPTDEPAAQPAPEPTTTDDEVAALPVPATAPTAISVDTPIRPTPMPPPVITPSDEPVDEPVTRPAPVELPQPDTDAPPQVDTATPPPPPAAVGTTAIPAAGGIVARPTVSATGPATRAATATGPATIAATAAGTTNRSPNGGRGRAGGGAGSQFDMAKFTPIQIADPLRLRRYQEFK